MGSVKIWLPPILTIVGTVIIVTVTSRLDLLNLQAMIEGLRQDLSADLAEKFGQIRLDMQRIENKLDQNRTT